MDPNSQEMTYKDLRAYEKYLTAEDRAALDKLDGVGAWVVYFGRKLEEARRDSRKDFAKDALLKYLEVRFDAPTFQDWLREQAGETCSVCGHPGVVFEHPKGVYFCGVHHP